MPKVKICTRTSTRTPPSFRSLHASDTLFDEKEFGPYVDIAGAKLSTPKMTLWWLLLCVVSAIFNLLFNAQFYAPIFSNSDPDAMTQQGTTSPLYMLNLHDPTLQTVSLLTSFNTITMPGNRRTKRNRVSRDTNALRLHALEQIPTPPMTVHQKFKFLEHIAKVFFFILQEFMNNEQNRPPHRNIPDFPEAFHRSLFDLQILTDQFLETSTQENYNIAARILHLMATASTEDEDQLLQFALQELRRRYPQPERSPVTTIDH